LGPTIILDKSSLQALSKKELIILNKLYFVNVPPILPIEILADLKKVKDSETLNEKTVIEISNKLIQSDNYYNIHYSFIMISALLGLDYLNERRTLVKAKSKVKDKDDEIGFLLEESDEQKAVREWQKGNFSESEKILAAQWRSYVKQIDLQVSREQWSGVKNKVPECNSFSYLLSLTDSFIANVPMQDQLIFAFLEDLPLDQKFSSKIFYRWQSENFKFIKDFAPYFYFVNRINTAFHIGLVYNLISAKTSDKTFIDLEYLYYLPFCNIFSSRDHFHKDFGVNFLFEDQTFIDGDELKADLGNIILKLESEDGELKIDWDENFHLEPPDDKDSFTYKMWRKYLPSWHPGWFYRKSAYPQKDEKLSSELNERVQQLENIDFDPFEKFKDKETDFTTTVRYITLDDQCPCGSGKKFKDCCFNKANG
jgi:hypothetical protein